MGTTQKLLTDYYRFLSSNYQIHQLADADEIVTPLTDFIGDNITIYLSRLGAQQIQLDDDGYTLDNLSLMGIALSDTRKQIVKQICNQYQVALSDDGVLYVKGSLSNFPQMKLNLTSAMLKIGDLYFTQRARVKNMFVEDVVAELKRSDLGGIPSSFQGRTGIEYRYPYVVPQRQTHPLKVVDVINNLTNGIMMQSAFQFNDIRNNAEFDYRQPKFLLIYNDQMASPSKSVLQIASDTGITPLPFSSKTAIKQVLAE